MFGLFEPSLDLRGEAVKGLAPDFVFRPYRGSPAEFRVQTPITPQRGCPLLPARHLPKYGHDAPEQR